MQRGKQKAFFQLFCVFVDFSCFSRVTIRSEKMHCYWEKKFLDKMHIWNTGIRNYAYLFIIMLFIVISLTLFQINQWKNICI